jgi:hypothetical protein
MTRGQSRLLAARAHLDSTAQSGMLWLPDKNVDRPRAVDNPPPSAVAVASANRRG